MNKVESIQDIFGIEAKAPAEWEPTGGDLVPHPGAARVTRRIIVEPDRRIYEETIEYPAPEPDHPEPYEFVTRYGPPDHSPAETAQIVADWHAGRAVWVGGPPDPDQALRDAFSPRPRVVAGRIVLQE